MKVRVTYDGKMYGIQVQRMFYWETLPIDYPDEFLALAEAKKLMTYPRVITIPKEVKTNELSK